MIKRPNHLMMKMPSGKFGKSKDMDNKNLLQKL